VSDIESISAITLVTSDMRRAVRFYAALGFEKRYGGETADFTSFHVGEGYLNLGLRSSVGDVSSWGRAILYVVDVDAMHARVVAAGFEPEFEPRDATWGERYFHVRDPDGHELSFARLLDTPT
jgi:catechol 2,3-dioxygenase-like lactoylglutathione lyase family enzyme